MAQKLSADNERIKNNASKIMGFTTKFVLFALMQIFTRSSFLNFAWREMQISLWL